MIGEFQESALKARKAGWAREGFSALNRRKCPFDLGDAMFYKDGIPYSIRRICERRFTSVRLVEVPEGADFTR